MNPPSRNEYNKRKHGLLWPMFFLFSFLLLLSYLLLIILPSSPVDDLSRHPLFFDETASSMASNSTKEALIGDESLASNEPPIHVDTPVNSYKIKRDNIIEVLDIPGTQIIPVQSAEPHFQPPPTYNQKLLTVQKRVIQGEVIVKSISSQESVIYRKNGNVEQGAFQKTLSDSTQQSVPTGSGHSIGCGQPRSIQYQDAPASQELFIISQLKYGQLILSDELFAYQEEGKQYLPMQLLAELLMLPIQFDVDSSSLSGWYLSPEKKIDVSNNLMMFWGHGSDCSIKQTRVFYDDWDLYVESKVIEQMFGLTIIFEPSRQRFSILESASVPLSQIGRAHV